jgi:hypothetical protein
VAAATGPQQVTVATTMAATVPSILLAPSPVSGSQVVVVDVPDNDTPPPRWDQWEILSAPAPEPPVGVLVMRATTM